MIVSHLHRYIFVAMPKTGTHSVRQALREHLGPDGIEQVGLFVNKVDQVDYHLPEGEAAEVDNMGVHAVTNAGDTDRIHLIFEYFDPDQTAPEWLARVQTGA